MVYSRRSFLQKTTLAAGVATLMQDLTSPAQASTRPLMPKDDISLAQWALVDEIRAGQWTTLDFPRIAREDFGLNGIEFVNTLFEVPTIDYLNKLKQNAKEHDVAMVLIMVDAEGDGAEPTAELRQRFVTAHKKWVDIAHHLGCHAVRTNCRAPVDADKNEAMKWALESYHMLLDYAVPAGIKICIENHGGVSNDADWMVQLMESIDNLYFATYPDWRSPSPEFDNVQFLRKTIPYACGQSYRNQPTEALSAQMIQISRDAGYRGWYGIESSGRDAINEGIRVLRKYL